MLFNITQVKIRTLNLYDSYSVCQEFNVSKMIFYKNGLIILGALWEDEIIGIISIYYHLPHSCILSELQVIPIFRCHGVGNLLINSAEQMCKRNKCNVMRCIIDDDSLDFQIIKNILIKQEWNSLGADHNYYRISINDINKTFISRHSVIFTPDKEPDIQVKNISQIDSKEWLSLDRYIDKIPDSLRPLPKASNIIEKYTLFILKCGNIIGWLTTTKQSEEEICVENIFILKEYRNKGYGIILLGILKQRLQSNNDISPKYMSYFTNDQDKNTKKLYSVLFGNCIDKQVDYYVFQKII